MNGVVEIILDKYLHRQMDYLFLYSVFLLMILNIVILPLRPVVEMEFQPLEVEIIRPTGILQLFDIKHE